MDIPALGTFLASPLADSLRSTAEIYREYPFTLLLPAIRLEPAAGEDDTVLLQGVVDCAIVEDDSITIIDFKTDFVTEESLPGKVSHYRPQVMAYADAMKKIYEKEVKSAILYFFGMDTAVEML